MARTWSWADAVAGKRQQGTNTGGGNYISTDYPFNMGDKKRITLPYVTKEDGTKEMLIFSVPVHRVRKRGFLKFPVGNQGKTFAPYTVRCMNPMSQTEQTTRVKIAERGQYCALCTMASLQTAHRFAKIDEKYGSFEAFKAIPKDDPAKVAFNAELNGMEKIGSSYDSRSKTTYYENYVLVLDFETKTETVTSAFGNTDVTRVMLNNDGTPKFTPILMKASSTRLAKFQQAVGVAGSSGAITEADLHPFEDANGDTVATAFIDLELNFPVKEQKMNSAAEMTATAVKSSDSVITPEFIAKIQEQSADLINRSTRAFENITGLKEFTNDEIISYMEDGGEYLRFLEANYSNARQKEHEEKSIQTVLTGQNMFTAGDSSSATTETPTDTTAETTVSETVVKPDTAISDLLNI